MQITLYKEYFVIFFKYAQYKYTFKLKLEMIAIWHISYHVASKGFWRWCVALRITGFLDFVHRPVF
jgi:hypothetical protein